MLEFETVERGGVDGDCERSAEIKYKEGEGFCLGFAVDKNNKINAHKARYLGVIVLPPWVALAVRLRPGIWDYLRVNVHALVVENLQPAEFLKFKEELVDGREVKEGRF
ncbi:sucrose synthase [Medicago truncatula]|uniref:sucrose synthase n=1 Tax=Medicago truncatula TaxID=3880 RepID=G7JLQ3_MEDTR|nr:sucrose synthase [Medicago truncatula]